MFGKSNGTANVRSMLFLASLLLLLPGISSGGDMTPPAGPGDTSSYTLEDVYNRLNTGAAGVQGAEIEPSSPPPPGGTQYTINEIMDMAPAKDDANGATASDVAAGQTFWGLTEGQWGPRVGTAVAGGGCTEALTPKTGQTKCYHASGAEIACAGTGQDGELQEGLAWPNPRFTDNEDGTVTDNLTGLVWLKNANCAGLKNWTDALAFANSLYDGWTGASGGDCDLSDGSVAGAWRLPNIRELHGLVDFGRYGPALPLGHPFTGVVSSGYWSSTSDAYDTGHAWNVYLTNGNAHGGGRTSTNYVWPVRAGQ